MSPNPGPLSPPAPQAAPAPPASLIPDAGGSIIKTPPAAPAAPAFDPSTLREFGDPMATRRAIYDDVYRAASELEPMDNDRHSLRLTNVAWQDPDTFTRKQRKEALLTGGTIARRLKGTWSLHDKATGDVLDQRDQVIARVPHLFDAGTFVFRGNDTTLQHQQRLKAGSFVRRKDNGELEAHANLLPGKGVGHRYLLDPDKGLFKIKMGQAEMPVLPLLKAMGTTDQEFRDAWGADLYAANMQKSEAGVLNKLAAKILPKADRENLDEGYRRQKLVEAFGKMQLDPDVMKRTLGMPATGVTKEVILATTKKLLGVSRGEAKVDDRDHLAYQSFFGPEDLFAERIRRDHGRVRKTLFMKASLDGNLRKFPSSAMTPQLEQALMGSGLGQAVEEINPAEVFDKLTRITRMGEGGIPSLEAIPDEARGVQPSHMGFMDPLRTPESFRVGVDVHMSRNARKGRDGKIYAQFKNARTGELEWKSPSDISDEAIAFPGGLRAPAVPPVGLAASYQAAIRRQQAGRMSPQDEATIEAWQKVTAKQPRRIPVMKGGEITYVPRDEVSYELPHFEDAFSPLGNLIPLKSMVKGQRVAMGSRYITQALPLDRGEAPWVQGAVPGSNGERSFEEEYGKHLGAVRSDKGGKVLAVSPEGIKVQHEDGTTAEIELDDHMPFNRKTYSHHTPMVKPGDVFKPGQLLARSNYTDDEGRVALGSNLRVAYMPWKGYNFEDAYVISESAAAKKLVSQHMYQHNVDVDDRSKMGKAAYVSLFPGTYDRKTLDSLDEHGLIKPGSKVEYGQPLILAARERDRSENRVHKKGQAGHSDATVVWKHHDSGIVTDVVRGKDGPVVLVKSTSAMQVGDKMSGRYGDKGVVASIVPDDQMPHGADGKPYEVLLNPLGIISRTNPAQKVEAMLGKIAEITGKPVKVKDFDDVEDMTEWAEKELAKHGIKDLEDLTDPSNSTKIKGIATGNRWFMKLHHTAESKGQGRGGGSYDADDAPSKGGEAGCFTGDTLVHTANGLVPIAELVSDKAAALVDTVHQYGRSFGHDVTKMVTDWFVYRCHPSQLVEVELEDGSVVRCTRNHVFVLSDGTRKLACELTPSDDLRERRHG